MVPYKALPIPPPEWYRTWSSTQGHTWKQRYGVSKNGYRTCAMGAGRRVKAMVFEVDCVCDIGNIVMAYVCVTDPGRLLL